MAVDVFSVPVFFVSLRETIETAIVVSVLLAFLKRTLKGDTDEAKQTYKRLVRQVTQFATSRGLRRPRQLQI
jgi:high-affinity iron transporter